MSLRKSLVFSFQHFLRWWWWWHQHHITETRSLSIFFEAMKITHPLTLRGVKNDDHHFKELSHQGQYWKVSHPGCVLRCLWLRIVSITFPNFMLLWGISFPSDASQQVEASSGPKALFQDATIIFAFYNCSSKGCCELIHRRPTSSLLLLLISLSLDICVDLKNFKFISTSKGIFGYLQSCLFLT